MTSPSRRERRLRLRIATTRAGAVRAFLLALLFGVPEFLASQAGDATRSVTMTMAVPNPVGVFSRIEVPGNATLARDGSAVSIGAFAPGPFTPPTAFILAGKGAFGQPQSLLNVRYDNSVNALSAPTVPGSHAGLAMSNRLGGQPWVLRARPSAVFPGRQILWFRTLSSPAAGFNAFGIDDQGSIRFARWTTPGLTCNPASEIALFSGVPGAGHTVPNSSGDVLHVCDSLSGCQVSGPGIVQLCAPFRDW